MGQRVGLLALCFTLTATCVQAENCGEHLEKQSRSWRLRATTAVEAIIPSRHLLTMVAPPSALLATGVDPVVANFFGIGWCLAYLKIKSSRGMVITGRHVWNYLRILRLTNYPFQNKQILDLGSGRSYFGSVIGWIYGSTGTRVVNLDIAHGVQKGNRAVTADMRELPFAANSFDLVVSNWAAVYLKQEVAVVVSEALRVLRPGGTIKFRIWRQNTPIEEQYDAVIKMLRSDNRVESFSIDRIFLDPVTYLLTVVGRS